MRVSLDECQLFSMRDTKKKKLFFFSPCDLGVCWLAYLFCCGINSRRKLVVFPFKQVISGRVLNFPDARSSQSVMQDFTQVNICLWSDDNKK